MQKYHATLSGGETWTDLQGATQAVVGYLVGDQDLRV
jgi:hypothetical protein